MPQTFQQLEKEYRACRIERDKLREALEATQWGFNHCRCPVCAGWDVGPYGETDFAHTNDCIVRQALTPDKRRNGCGE